MKMVPLKFDRQKILTWAELAVEISKFSDYQLLCPVVVEIPESKHFGNAAGGPIFGDLKICDENHPTLDEYDPVIFLV